MKTIQPPSKKTGSKQKAAAINGTKRTVKINGGGPESDPMTVDEAEKYVKRFRDTTVTPIDIPQAILFDSDDLAILTSRYQYIRFYCGIAPGTSKLTLIAVGVDTDNVDDITSTQQIGGQTFNFIYEFADPCPPCIKGGKPHANNSKLHPAGTPETVRFTR